MKLDILAFGVHPDDVELGCSGVLINEINKGKKAGIIDLTQGELGTRGTSETRFTEAAAAAKIMGVHVRDNMKMRDGFFRNDEEHQLKIIQQLPDSSGINFNKQVDWFDNIRNENFSESHFEIANAMGYVYNKNYDTN